MTNITRTETATRVTYAIAAEQYNGLGIFTIDWSRGSAALRMPHGLNWSVYSNSEEDDRAESEAIEALLWPLQAGNIAALVRLGVGRPIPVGGYVIATNWVKLYPTESAEVQYAAMPGASLYVMEKPGGDLVAAIKNGNQISFKLVSGW